jgi:hypothetical protein
MDLKFFLDGLLKLEITGILNTTKHIPELLWNTIEKV